MNLDFFSDLGKGLQAASEIGSQAYKIGKEVGTAGGNVWYAIDPEGYNATGAPIAASLHEIKDAGKAAGGWNAVNQMGQHMTGDKTMTPDEMAAYYQQTSGAYNGYMGYEQ